ncbi:MAG: response regulator [Oscillospiraceae bacterium]|nr:response regulator [Oscillospiraceae bacterium]
MLKLLVADMSEEFTSAVEKALHSEFEIKICQDGETALELLHYFKPDVLIMHLWLPFKDGLTVLQESTHKPRVIMALAHYMPRYAEKRALELGVQYVLFMPTVETLRVRLMDMIAEIQPREDTRVAVHLHALGFRTNLDGYRQLREGIPVYAQNPEMLLSKELYPAIGDIFGLPDCRTVEHSIRKAITDAWSRRNPIVWEKYFPGATEAPTNKVFISKLAEMSRP